MSPLRGFNDAIVELPIGYEDCYDRAFVETKAALERVADDIEALDAALVEFEAMLGVAASP